MWWFGSWHQLIAFHCQWPVTILWFPARNPQLLIVKVVDWLHVYDGSTTHVVSVHLFCLPSTGVVVIVWQAWLVLIGFETPTRGNCVKLFWYKTKHHFNKNKYGRFWVFGPEYYPAGWQENFLSRLSGAHSLSWEVEVHKQIRTYFARQSTNNLKNEWLWTNIQ